MSMPAERTRDEIPAKYTWDVQDIYASWEEWENAYAEFQEKAEQFVAMQGTLSDGADRLLAAYTLNDEIGMMSYKLYRYPQLMFDLDQRNNEVQARLQQVQAVFAEFGTKTAWFAPEILTISEEAAMAWVDEEPELEPYRFPLAEVYRSQEHVLDEDGERLLSYASRFNSSPAETYRALSTADVDWNVAELSDGTEVKVTPASYRRMLEKLESQADRRAVFEKMYDVFISKKNTYATIYNAVCQRDWASAQARKFESTAKAALDSNNVPISVLENLIETAKAGNEPLRRFHRLRAQHLGLDAYHLYDSSVPLVSDDTEYPFDDVTDVIVDSVRPLGPSYVDTMRTALTSRWIDVYETDGKRSGAYSASCYGVHPYMLLNYNDTLDSVFTLAHELGHTMHTVLSSEHQPFATSGYTIFVAEVASTTNEGLLLELLLEQADGPRERAALLEHAIGSIAGTFYTQAMFANFELEAHRMVERGEPMTADRLDALYRGLFAEYYGDAIVWDEEYATTWARIPHFFQSPYYVYQYATCFASSATLLAEIRDGDHEGAVARYLELLESGGNDHPMEQLRKAGIDLSKPETVQAVVQQMDDLVTRLEAELAQI
jgi:oligoendopeptidase F